MKVRLPLARQQEESGWVWARIRALRKIAIRAHAWLNWLYPLNI